MQIKLLEIHKKEKYFDVKFPIYREHDVTCEYGPSHIIYTRVDIRDIKTLICTDIHIIGHSQIEIKIERNYKLGNDPVDYLLGRGQYSSSKEEFEEALLKAKRILNEI